MIADEQLHTAVQSNVPRDADSLRDRCSFFTIQIQYTCLMDAIFRCTDSCNWRCYHKPPGPGPPPALSPRVQSLVIVLRLALQGISDPNTACWLPGMASKYSVLQGGDVYPLANAK